MGWNVHFWGLLKCISSFYRLSSPRAHQIAAVGDSSNFLGFVDTLPFGATIGWAVIEKSRPERDPKLTRLCDFPPTACRLWRHVQSKCKDYRGLCRDTFEVASSNSLRDIKKNHFVTAAAEGIKCVSLKNTTTTTTYQYYEVWIELRILEIGLKW